MKVTNTEEIAGETIKENLGLVKGNTIKAKHIGRDIGASLKNLVGGEVKGYTKMISEAREEAYQRMIEEAERLGADGVVNVRFSTSQVMQGAAEILAYGTAVKFK
ncbi:YbjQ family protein [Natroniella acetigena]|uniref:YbjQ family protein n=1 Tax=Natroniella acetigena TaxID=52004 RepID=UPI00200A199F|nr:YbjQ family protein [Natroniella acetigena]MCK8827720.1 YbjQ family protein [Natroniella acetigena]